MSSPFTQDDNSAGRVIQVPNADFITLVTGLASAETSYLTDPTTIPDARWFPLPNRCGSLLYGTCGLVWTVIPTTMPVITLLGQHGTSGTIRELVSLGGIDATDRGGIEFVARSGDHDTGSNKKYTLCDPSVHGWHRMGVTRVAAVVKTAVAGGTGTHTSSTFELLIQ